MLLNLKAKEMGPFIHHFHPTNIPDMVNGSKFWFILFLEDELPEDDEFLRCVYTDAMRYLCFVRGIATETKRKAIIGYVELVKSVSPRKVATAYFCDDFLPTEKKFNSIQVHSRELGMPLQGEIMIPRIKAASLQPTTTGKLQEHHFPENTAERKIGSSRSESSKSGNSRGSDTSEPIVWNLERLKQVRLAYEREQALKAKNLETQSAI